MLTLIMTRWLILGDYQCQSTHFTFKILQYSYFNLTSCTYSYVMIYVSVKYLILNIQDFKKSTVYLHFGLFGSGGIPDLCSR